MEGKSNLAYTDMPANNPAYNPSNNPDGFQQPPAYELPSQPTLYPKPYGAPQYPSNVTVVTVPPQRQNVQHVEDNMVISIVSLFFCCILGIFAIIKAQEAKDHIARGNYDMARMAARTAKNLAIIGIVLGCIGVVIGIVLGVVLPLVVYTSISTVEYSYDSSY
ncbi:hypothetical protein RRG08_025306 [Elysia crispata]|uniref:Uncharacterized protein n=1 Tax=Elysia crispata TaxID=231223 RepID=A0AAE1A9X5_9GAST|nr:hypothetical protein RRG08_025306 [Elysia crispata]